MARRVIIGVHLKRFNARGRVGSGGGVQRAHFSGKNNVRERVQEHEYGCRALYLWLKHGLSGCVSGLSDPPEPMRASARAYKQGLTSPCCFLEKLAGFSYWPAFSIDRYE